MSKCSRLLARSRSKNVNEERRRLIGAGAARPSGETLEEPLPPRLQIHGNGFSTFVDEQTDFIQQAETWVIYFR